MDTHNTEQATRKHTARKQRVVEAIKVGNFLGIQYGGCEIGVWRQQDGNVDVQVLLWEVVAVGRLAVTCVCKTGSFDMTTTIPYTALWDKCLMGTVKENRHLVNAWELTTDQLQQPLIYVNFDW